MMEKAFQNFIPEEILNLSIDQEFSASDSKELIWQLFGRKLGHNTPGYPLSAEAEIWMVSVDNTERSGWKNRYLDAEHNEVEEHNGNYDEDADHDGKLKYSIRILFEKIKNQNKYIYRGIYYRARISDDERTRVYKRKNVND